MTEPTPEQIAAAHADMQAVVAADQLEEIEREEQAAVQQLNIDTAREILRKAWDKGAQAQRNYTLACVTYNRGLTRNPPIWGVGDYANPHDAK